MNIEGKLFGFAGPVTPEATGAQSRCSATECPGFGWWYSLQMAKSYEATTHRASSNIVKLFADAPRRELPLAA